MTLKSVCCFRLHTVGIFFGWLGTIASFLITIAVSISLNNIDKIVEAIKNDNINISVEQLRLLVTVGLSIYLGLTLINLLASVLLIIGTLKERHMLIVPWLINGGFALIITILFSLPTVIANSTFIACIPVIIVFGIQLYIWYAIYSLYKKIQSDRDQTQRLIPHANTSYPSYTQI